MLTRFFKSAAVALALGALSGCQSDVDSQIALAGLSSSCHINSDCSADLACVFQRCHEQCSSSRDCDRGSRCVAGEGARNVCQLADEVGCGPNGSCRGDQVCGVDGECRDACGNDAGCIREQVCRAGTCADTDELDDQGGLAPSVARPEEAPIPCTFHSDCPGKLVCVSGACAKQCAADADCPPGSSCRTGVCEAPPEKTNGCLRNSDCKPSEQCRAGACEPLAPGPEPECDYDSDCAQSGQHCLSGACRCECAADADCSFGQVCQDSCQCVLGRVIQGNVYVVNQRQLEALANVVEITGQLMLGIAGPGEYHLPSLRKVGQFSAVEHRATIVADALEEVKQAFTCYQDCKAPRLKKAGSVTVNSTAMTSFELPALEESGDFSVWYSTVLGRVSAPQLKKATYLRVEGNLGLVELDFPKAAELTSILIGMNERVREISMPLANPAASVSISAMPALETLSLPSVSVLSADVQIANAPHLKKIDLSGFKQGGLLSLYSLPALSELLLPSLTDLTNAFTISACGGPATLDLPNWKNGSSFGLNNARISTVSAPKLEKLADLNINGMPLTALDLPVSKLTGMIYLYGNSELTSVSLPHVTSATSLNLILNGKLATLSLPALATVGDIAINASALTNLDSVTLGLGGSLKAAGSIIITDNAALPGCALDALQAALTGEGWGNSFTRWGNLQCTCAGAVCQ